MTTNKRLLEANSLFKLIKDETRPSTSEFSDGWNNALFMVMQFAESGRLDAQPAEVNAPVDDGLMPCPWCQKQPKSIYEEYCGDHKSKKYKVSCADAECPVNPETPFFKLELAARSAWNSASTRPASQWIPVSEWKIKCGQHVFVSYLNPLGKRRTVKAFYAEKFSIEQSEDSDNLDYDEKTDNYYFPEGWYEVIDNWDEFSSIAIYNGTVDYVMPLPPPPTREEV